MLKPLQNSMCPCVCVFNSRFCLYYKLLELDNTTTEDI